MSPRAFFAAAAAGFALAGCAGSGASSASTPAAPATTSPAAPPAGAGITTSTGVGGPAELSVALPASATSPPATVAQGVGVNAIQAQLASLFSLAQVGMPMTGIESLAQGQNVAQYFAPACQVTPQPGAQPIAGSGILAGELGDWFAHLQIGKFKLEQQYTKVAPDGSRGRAIILVKAELTFKTRVERVEGWYATDWAPVQGNWLIQNVTPLDVASNSKAAQTNPWVYFNPWWGPGWGYY